MVDLHLHFRSVLQLDPGCSPLGLGSPDLCHDDNGNQAVFLEAECENAADPERKVVRGGVLLNRCYANVNGLLVPVSDGKGQFANSCVFQNCTLEQSYHFLGMMDCPCKDRQGNVVNTTVNLGESPC
jgi:hypothetical protein